MVSWFLTNSEECFDVGWGFCIICDNRLTDDFIALRIMKF
jgi:hypothetical protein